MPDAFNNIYYSSFIGTFYTPLIVDLKPMRHSQFFELQLGIGWQDVQYAHILRAGDIPHGDTAALKATDDRVNSMEGIRVVSTRVTPLVRVDYVNHEANKFGTFMQYNHRWMFGGWLELIEGIRIEASYSAPFHPADPWEPLGFFMISPRIRIL
jgi:hypothetical protein